MHSFCHDCYYWFGLNPHWKIVDPHNQKVELCQCSWERSQDVNSPLVEKPWGIPLKLVPLLGCGVCFINFEFYCIFYCKNMLDEFFYPRICRQCDFCIFLYGLPTSLFLIILFFYVSIFLPLDIVEWIPFIQLV